jgi:AP-1-like transcription factor
MLIGSFQKRKAQNRAAQRAFRERKEKHLKDLETRVVELEKASESVNNENGLLRAQVERLQTELREYRRRLALNPTGLRNSPPSSDGFFSQLNRSDISTATNFQFEFPKFGSLPGSQIFSNGASSKSGAQKSPSTNGQAPGNVVSGVLARKESVTRSPSQTTNGVGTSFAASNPMLTYSPLEPLTVSNVNIATEFSPMGLYGYPSPFGTPTAANNVVRKPAPNVNTSSPREREPSLPNQSRVFRFNSGSTPSNTASPSDSTVSQYGPTSSPATSPECQNSPQVTKAVEQPKASNAGSTIGQSPLNGESSFCDELNMACGNCKNPVPRIMSNFNAASALSPDKATVDDANSIDWLANQNGGRFDPVLFGDYRDSQEAIVGDGDFTGGFFNDNFGFDWGSPLNFTEPQLPAIAPEPSKTKLKEKLERQQDDLDNAVVPGEDRSQLLNCNEIW